MTGNPQIISISRRTDIPAFYSEWLMGRIRDGVAGYVNPIGGNKLTVSLDPEDVLFIVFWSKNYKPLMGHLDELDRRGYKFYFQFTITGLPKELELGTPSWQSGVEQAQFLSQRYSPKHVLWRFDPIIFSTVTPMNRVRETFSDIASQIQGATERCYFSYVDYYGKVRRNFEQLYAEEGIRFRADSGSRKAILNARVRNPDAYAFDLTQQERLAFACELAEIAAGHGITLHTCCDDNLVHNAVPQIDKAHCVDNDLISELLGTGVGGKLNPTREDCGCWESRDIGAYNTCPHACMYCYANANKDTALQHYRQNVKDPTSFALGCSADRCEFPPLPPEGFNRIVPVRQDSWDISPGLP